MAALWNRAGHYIFALWFLSPFFLSSSFFFFSSPNLSDNRKNLLSSNISSTCPHNMVNFSLAAEIVSLVWGTPANFNGFHVLASLLQLNGSQPNFAHWPLPGLVKYIISGGCCSVTEFCQVQNSLCVLQVLQSPILTALLHDSREVGPSQTLRR